LVQRYRRHECGAPLPPHLMPLAAPLAAALLARGGGGGGGASALSAACADRTSWWTRVGAAVRQRCGRPPATRSTNARPSSAIGVDIRLSSFAAIHGATL
jgi:hypothetical protein